MNSRQAALNILEKCFSGESLSGQLEALLQKGVLNCSDYSLAANISIGTVQNYRLLDYYISAYSTVPDRKIHPRVRNILRIGIYQLLFLDRVPAFAAINETAALCKGSLSHVKGFVNALLRKISVNKEKLPELKAENPTKLLALKYSQPDFLAEMLVSEYGPGKAEVILAANNEKPELSVFINCLKTDPDAFARLLSGNSIEYSRSPFYDDGFLIQSMSATDIPGFKEGLFYVQDPSAHFLSTIFKGMCNPAILDCCAAPGGKSISSAMACNCNCRIISCDVSEGKTSLIRSNAERLGLECLRTEVCDASVFKPEFRSKFDAVIADVPCSGLGVIRKHPEIRFKTEDSISSLMAQQKKILANVAEYVKSGGLLIYSTCSINPAENRCHVNDFLKENGCFRPVEYSYKDFNLSDGCIDFLPGINGGDGFFTAVMQRVQ